PLGRFSGRGRPDHCQVDGSTTFVERSGPLRVGRVDRESYVDRASLSAQMAGDGLAILRRAAGENRAALDERLQAVRLNPLRLELQAWLPGAELRTALF